MKIYDLPVMGYDRAKSFYGKAKVIEKDNGEKVLQSYNTEVCKISSNGEFVRLWDGYSVTTMRHVNSFLSFSVCLAAVNRGGNLRMLERLVKYESIIK